MKIKLLLIFLLACMSGVVFAQKVPRVINDESEMQGKKLFEGIKFVNKRPDNIAFADVIALDTFSFEGNFAKPGAAKELTVRSCDFNKSHFQGPYFRTLTFENCHFQKAPIFKSLSDSVDSYIADADFHDCTFTDGLNLSYITIGNGLSVAGTMSGVLDLSNMNIGSPSAKIDLMRLYPDTIPGPNKDPGGKITIDLKGAPIANIIMDYNRFVLEPSSLDDQQDATSIYTALLANFKNRGFDESYELADIDFQQYKGRHGQTLLGKLFLPCIDRMQDLWWKYGYEKFRILVITPGLLLIFTLINLAFYKKLNKSAYTINDEEIAKQGVSFYNSLVYTSVIFFSFTLKLENLHFKSRGLSLWLIFIYLSGIICLGFLANYVLKS